jgi:hypothetical protein
MGALGVYAVSIGAVDITAGLVGALGIGATNIGAFVAGAALIDTVGIVALMIGAVTTGAALVGSEGVGATYTGEILVGEPVFTATNDCGCTVGVAAGFSNANEEHGCPEDVAVGWSPGVVILLKTFPEASIVALSSKRHAGRELLNKSQ